MADALVLACGAATVPALEPTLEPALEPTPESPAPEAVEVVELPWRPGRDVVDPVLDRLGDRRLIIAGTDADLAAVTLRLLRTARLGSVLVGFVPAIPPTRAGPRPSAAAAAFGLPLRPDQAMRLALRGDADPVPLIRDDAGGVLVGLGLLRRLRGVVYCDDDRVLRGMTPLLEVSPDPDAGRDARSGGLVVRVWDSGLFRRGRSESYGRAVQIGCAPNQPVSDGIEHERPVRRWTWYRHTEDLRLIRGLI